MYYLLKFVKNNKFGSLIKNPEQLVIKNGVEFLIKETAVVYLITTQSNVVVTVKDLYNNVLKIHIKYLELLNNV